MVRDFDGYCPDTVGQAATTDSALAEALLRAHESGTPGVCAAFVLSQEVFSGDRPQCIIPNDCLFLRK